MGERCTPYPPRTAAPPISTSVSSTICKSKVERLMTLSTLAVAVCCARASASSRALSASSRRRERQGNPAARRPAPRHGPREVSEPSVAFPLIPNPSARGRVVSGPLMPASHPTGATRRRIPDQPASVRGCRTKSAVRDRARVPGDPGAAGGEPGTQRKNPSGPVCRWVPALTRARGRALRPGHDPEGAARYRISLRRSGGYRTKSAVRDRACVPGDPGAAEGDPGPSPKIHPVVPALARA